MSGFLLLCFALPCSLLPCCSLALLLYLAHSLTGSFTLVGTAAAHHPAVKLRTRSAVQCSACVRARLRDRPSLTRALARSPRPCLGDFPYPRPAPRSPVPPVAYAVLVVDGVQPSQGRAGGQGWAGLAGGRLPHARARLWGGVSEFGLEIHSFSVYSTKLSSYLILLTASTSTTTTTTTSTTTNFSPSKTPPNSSALLSSNHVPNDHPAPRPHAAHARPHPPRRRLLSAVCVGARCALWHYVYYYQNHNHNLSAIIINYFVFFFNNNNNINHQNTTRPNPPAPTPTPRDLDAWRPSSRCCAATTATTTMRAPRDTNTASTTSTVVLATTSTTAPPPAKTARAAPPPKTAAHTRAHVRAHTHTRARACAKAGKGAGMATGLRAVRRRDG
ncbi:uncharacterized protein K452DRAFT_362211 [Aplosporella prunicola CBS 121167]|uniref:Uncharacterized protein n=1 Tax=Aplosporella prunicola CBS 121167 TaxID=1176127 RepID=A0A6A6AYG5_9PEZI|nr:uncharacterized protein K452DRAFT_362211 [Aplosporella prunicola CBS 121167]KAF2136972.1 hypothetical protein K452DRAFT_362211 [Aplosporella prunicola CBS 121167]